MGGSRSWLFAIALTLSCASPRTALVIVVDSDLAVPSRLASVHAEAGASQHEFVLDSMLRPPFSFGVEPSGGSTAPIDLRIEGRDPTGSAIVSYSARVGFLAGRTVVLHVRLDADCEAVVCEQDTTCIDGTCSDDRIDVLTLPPLVPGHELDRDAGPRLDGSIDDAGDTGPSLPRSCAEVPSDSVSGVFAIDPDGAGGAEPLDVFCETALNEGGWTLIAKAEARSDTLAWAHAAWTAPDRASAFGTNDASESDAILPAYWRVPVRELRIVMIDSDGTRALVAPLDVTDPITLRAAMDREGGVAIAAGLGAWAELAGVTPLASPACVASRVRSEAAGAPVRVRVGVTASEDVSCLPSMMWIGIGAEAASQGGSCRATSYAAGAARLCSPRESHQTSVLVFGR